MTRPRQPYSFHVKRRGPSWVGYWRVFEDDKLVVHQRVIGLRKEINKTEAAERHAAWVKEHVPAYGVVPETPTLRQLWERTIADERRRASRGKLSASTVGQHVSYWKHLEPLAAVKARDITGERIEDLFDSMKLASKSKKHVRQMLRTILKPIGATAVDDAKMRFETSPKGDTLAGDVILGILRQLPTSHDQMIFQLCLITGLRASELARLTGTHLRDAGFIHAPGTKTELSNSRIPLIPELWVPLSKLAEERGPGVPLLFSQKTHRQWLERVFQPAASRAGVENADMLMLRRTAITKGAKIDESAIAKIARHTTTRMVRDVYDSAADDQMLDVQAQVWASFTGAVRPS